MKALVPLLLILATFAASAAPPAPVAADERDGRVLEAALLHILTEKKFSFVGRETKPDGILLLEPLTPERIGFIQEGQIKSDLRGRENVDLPTEVAADLQRRNVPANPPPKTYFTIRGSFAGLKFSPRIVISEFTNYQELDSKFPRMQRDATAFLPGYSADGETAVVRAIIGPSPHGGTATVLLEKRGETWVVKWSVAAWYA